MIPKKILLVDDDRELLYGMEVWLRSKGFRVFKAGDGAAAMAAAKAEEPDLIVLDIGLPGGDGYLTMARLRSLMPLAHIPIIVMTAGDAAAHREKAMQAGAEAFFTKPFQSHELLAGIEKALVDETPENLEEELKDPDQKKILIVDDDRDLLQALRVRLTSSGFKVHFASDAVQAGALAARVCPDLILLDVGLPAGDGYLAMERIRSRDALARIPIIIMTAGDPNVHREKARLAGAEAFFPKPIDHKELIAAIRKTLVRVRAGT